MATLKLSVIVPLFNVEKYVRRCIDSILNQEYQNFELILVDDGSTDNSGQICDEYAITDERIIVIHKENGGVSSARNLGIEKALGKWITFIDADDMVEPKFFSWLDNESETAADWVFTEWKTVWNNGEKTIEHPCKGNNTYSSKVEIIELWTQNAHIDIFRCPWGKFFKRSIIMENNLCFNTQLRYAEDTLFNYEYLTKTKTIITNKRDLAHYIFHQFSNTRAVSKYKCTPENLVISRDKIFDIYFKLGLNNLRFERLFFFSFTMMEHCFKGKPEGQIRKEYYHSPIQILLENKCISTIRFYDKWMYLAFKRLPHGLIAPLATIYLKFR